MRYPTELKEKAIKRLLDTERPTINELSQDLDIPEVTLYYWDRQIKNGKMGKISRKPHSLLEKQQLIYEYQSLSEEDKGIWLRELGFYSNHIDTWKKEITEALDGAKEYPKKEKAWKKETKTTNKGIDKKRQSFGRSYSTFSSKKKLDALFGKEPEDKQ